MRNIYPAIAVALCAEIFASGCGQDSRGTQSIDHKSDELAITIDLASREMPRRVTEAQAGIAVRTVNIAKTWIRAYTYQGRFDDWNDRAAFALRKIGAALYAFANPELFADWDYDWQAELAAADLDFDGGNCATPLECYQNKVMQYLDTAYIYADAGTGEDYDFVLNEIITLLYAFRDRADILTSDMAYALLCQDECQFGTVPFSGNELYDYQTNYINAIVVHFYQAETENHVAMTYTWRYLINQWVRNMAYLPTSHPRYDARVVNLYHIDPNHYANGYELEDFLMQVSGRVVHSGLFETNGRAYASFTTSALMNLASYAGANFAPRFEDTSHRLRIGAQNALDLLAARFAFQSLEGKRVVPMRRNWDHRRKMGPYINDYYVDIFGILSGAYLFEERYDAQESRYHYADINGPAGQPAGFALWSGLRDYRVPSAILDFMIDKHDGFWSRSQSRFSLSSYPIFYESIFSTPDLPSRHAMVRPRYFRSDGSRDMGGSVVGTPEFHYITNNFMSISGGHHRPYYDVPFSLEIERDYDYLAKPHMLVPAGLGDLLNWGNGDDSQAVADASEDIMLTRGHENRYYESKGGAHMYKGFTYGYIHKDEGSLPSNYHNRFAMIYPASWASFQREEFTINRARFRVFDFSTDAAPIPGHYLVVAKVSKSENSGQYRNYARGFWEIVPADRYATAADLGQYIRDRHRSSDFDDNTSRDYRYYMTTGDVVDMDPRAFSTATNQPLRRVWIPTRNGNGDIIAYSEADMRDKLTVLGDQTSVDNMPLLKVWELDQGQEFTGWIFAEADGEGRLTVDNPFLSADGVLHIDSSDYRNPSRQITH